MNRILLIFSSIILISFSCGAQNIQDYVSVNKQNWILKTELSDEFNTSSINWEKWSKKTDLPNTKAWIWNNDTNAKIVSYKGETAVALTVRHNKKNKKKSGAYFNSGCLQSIKQLPEGFKGYVEARIYGANFTAKKANGLDKKRGVCPSFWLYSDFHENLKPGEPIYTEIDVVELQQFDYDPNTENGKNNQDDIDDAESNLHLVLQQQNGKREWFRPKQPKARAKQLNKYNLGFDPTAGWHTYGCKITDEDLTFYVDGKKVGKVLENTFWNKNSMKVIASLGVRVPFVNFGGNTFNVINPEKNSRASKSLEVLPLSMYVDYIRVWEQQK